MSFTQKAVQALNQAPFNQQTPNPSSKTETYTWPVTKQKDAICACFWHIHNISYHLQYLGFKWKGMWTNFRF